MNQLDTVARIAAQLNDIYDSGKTNALVVAVAELREEIEKGDRCTVEERAVLEAAIKKREVYLAYGEAYHEYDADLDNAVDALIAVRAKEGK